METNIILRYPWPQTDSLILWYKFLANQVNLTNLWLDTSLHVWAMNKTCFEGSASLTPEVAGIRIRLMTMPSKWAYFYTPQIFKHFALRLVCHFKKYRKKHFHIQSSHTTRAFATLENSWPKDLNTTTSCLICSAWLKQIVRQIWPILWQTNLPDELRKLREGGRSS